MVVRTPADVMSGMHRSRFALEERASSQTGSFIVRALKSSFLVSQIQHRFDSEKKSDAPTLD